MGGVRRGRGRKGICFVRVAHTYTSTVRALLTLWYLSEIEETATTCRQGAEEARATESGEFGA